MSRDNVQMTLGHTGLNHKIDWYFASIGQGVNAHTLKRRRLRQIIQLEAKSDAELASLGLTRDAILPHVFRDLLAA